MNNKILSLFSHTWIQDKNPWKPTISLALNSQKLYQNNEKRKGKAPFITIMQWIERNPRKKKEATHLQTTNSFHFLKKKKKKTRERERERERDAPESFTGRSVGWRLNWSEKWEVFGCPTCNVYMDEYDECELYEYEYMNVFRGFSLSYVVVHLGEFIVMEEEREAKSTTSSKDPPESTMRILLCCTPPFPFFPFRLLLCLFSIQLIIIIHP